MEAMIDRAFTKLEDIADVLPDEPIVIEACLHNIMCQCERRHCPGKTLSTKYFVRKMRDA